MWIKWCPGRGIRGFWQGCRIASVTDDQLRSTFVHSPVFISLVCAALPLWCIRGICDRNIGSPPHGNPAPCSQQGWSGRCKRGRCHFWEREFLKFHVYRIVYMLNRCCRRQVWYVEAQRIWNVGAGAGCFSPAATRNTTAVSRLKQHLYQNL